MLNTISIFKRYIFEQVRHGLSMIYSPDGLCHYHTDVYCLQFLAVPGMVLLRYCIGHQHLQIQCMLVGLFSLHTWTNSSNGFGFVKAIWTRYKSHLDPLINHQYNCPYIEVSFYYRGVYLLKRYPTRCPYFRVQVGPLYKSTLLIYLVDD